MLHDFNEKAKTIQIRHKEQNAKLVIELNNKYENKTTFNHPIWELIEMLKGVIDPTDKKLYLINQFIHTLQVAEAADEATHNEEIIVAALVHDLGKLLLLTDEKPENIVCENWVIQGDHNEGLENAICNWNHDEFIYMKLKNHLPDHLLWLIRFHSIRLPDSYIYMSETDKKLTETYLNEFRIFDRRTKGKKLPEEKNFDKYRKILEKWFPNPIAI